MISEVRLILTQPYPADSGAAPELLTRRRAATDALAVMTGAIGT